MRALSLRTRLTLWYGGLLLVAIVLFSVVVLWLDWRLQLKQSDEALSALSEAAVNVVAGELEEHATLPQAAGEMASVVRHPDYALAVLDADGVPIRQMRVALPMRTPTVVPDLREKSVSTVVADDRRSWRVMLRTGEAMGHRFTVVVGEPLTEVTEHWRAMRNACALGIPFVLAIAAGGGWALGRRGLRPLSDMATQARRITARTPDGRLTVPSSAPELEAVAVAFNRVLERLGTALSTQRQFMADASHELRTPVSVMRTAADVTLSQPVREEAEYRDALTVVGQQTAGLARLVDDMLALARADAGGYPVTRADLDLDALVADCVRDVTPRAAAKEIRVTSRLEPVSVVGDDTLLRRMLVNLLNNAISYTPRGGTVDVAMMIGPGAISIRVSDTGRGIPAEDRARVFERFVRLDPSRGAGGAGLGLSIAQWIAEAHGGKVELLTSSPSGSVFSATIPITHD